MGVGPGERGGRLCVSPNATMQRRNDATTSTGNVEQKLQGGESNKEPRGIRCCCKGRNRRGRGFKGRGRKGRSFKDSESQKIERISR